MTKTTTGEPYLICGSVATDVYYTYPCKYENKCPKYNPDYTLKVTLGIKDHPKRQRICQKPNPCTNGGGINCPSWKHYTNQDLDFYDPLPMRSFYWEKKP